MEEYFLTIVIIGLLGFATSWLPFVSKKINVSYSIAFLILGWIAYWLIGSNLPWPNPIREQELTVRLTELLVIIALMGTGLTIDRKFSFKAWRAPLRLAGIYMLVSAALLAGISFYWIGLPIAVSLLMGAVTAPTDPVLASDVQVGPPNSKDSDDVRFTLTAEAGMNDGLAFPLTWLAILCAQTTGGTDNFLRWIEFDVLWRIGCGAAMGYLVGKAVAYLFFTLPDKYNVSTAREGLVALSATIFTYGLTELFNGYGFIAVFICALTVRNHEFDHEYHKELHTFITQVEKVLLSVLIFLFGGSLYSGILDGLNWKLAITAFVFVLILRPLVARISLVGIKMKPKEKWLASFFGIKGIGSFFYLSFALKKHDFELEEELWSFVALTVLISLIVHGLSAVWSMKNLREDLDSKP